MRLYGYWRSSSTYRVRILLGLKGIELEYVPVHLLKEGGEQNVPDFVKKSPFRQVPVLELRSPSGLVHLSQSMAIAEYLEEARPEPSIYPADAWSKAKAREIAEIVNSGIQPLQNLRVLRSLEAMGASPRTWVQEVVARGFFAIEALLRKTAGTYAVGDRVGVADAFLVPQLYAARRFDVPLHPYPTLLRVEAACLELSAFERAHPDRQPDAPPPEERTA